MRVIRSAALAGCVLLALVVAAGASAEGQPGKPGGGDTAKLKAAGQACQAKGLKPGSDAFKQCVKGQLGGGDTNKGGGDLAKLKAAGQACQAQGLTPGSDAFKQCVKDKVGGTGGGPDPGKVKAAAQACLAKGLAAGTDAFNQCVKSQLGGGAGGSGDGRPASGKPASGKPAPPAPGTGGIDPAKLKAAAQVCQAQGLKPETDAFRQCVKSQLSGNH